MLIKSKKINEGGLISDMADIALYLELYLETFIAAYSYYRNKLNY